MAHCDFVYWKVLWEAIEKADQAFQEPLKAIAQVFSLSILQAAHKELVPPHALTANQRKLLHGAHHAVIEKFATHYAQLFIDEYGFTEYEMDSALARAYQTPYEALLNGAKASEMNNMQHLWPMMVETRSLWKQYGAKL